MRQIDKDPDAVLDYTWNWGDWLQPGETIASHSVAASGVSVITSGPDGAARQITAWLAGGAAGTIATATCRITTSAGRTDDRTGRLRVIER